MQGNSELVVHVIDTLDLVLGVRLQLGSEVVLYAQQGFVNLVSITSVGDVVLGFFEVVAGQEGPGVYVVRSSQLVATAFTLVTIGVILQVAFGVDTGEVEAVDGIVCAQGPLGLLTAVASDGVFQVGVSVTGIQALRDPLIFRDSNNSKCAGI